jgi:FkbM family methyltransferase
MLTSIPLTAKLSNTLLAFYCRHMPNHPGKWRVAAALEKLARDSWVTTRIARCQGIWYELDLRDFVARSIFLNLYENSEVRCLRKILRSGSIVVDVGANIGFYSLLCAQLIGDAGHVYAFEPVASTADRLVRNIELNHARNVTPIRSAVGSRCGTTAMGPVPEKNAGKAQIATNIGAPCEQVPITSLDSFMAHSGLTRLDFVKVDIEGFEMEFLSGAKISIARFRPVLLMELNPGALGQYGTTPGAVIAALKGAGYDVQLPTRRGLRPLSSYPHGRAYCNVFAIPVSITSPQTPGVETRRLRRTE